MSMLHKCVVYLRCFICNWGHKYHCMFRILFDILMVKKVHTEYELSCMYVLWYDEFLMQLERKFPNPSKTCLKSLLKIDIIACANIANNNIF